MCTGGPCCPWHPLPTNQNSILPFAPWPTTILSQSEVTLPLGALLMEWDGIHAVETLTFTHIPLHEGDSLWGGYVTSWHLQAVVAVGTSPLPSQSGLYGHFLLSPSPPHPLMVTGGPDQVRLVLEIHLKKQLPSVGSPASQHSTHSGWVISDLPRDLLAF